MSDMEKELHVLQSETESLATRLKTLVEKEAISRQDYVMMGDQFSDILRGRTGICFVDASPATIGAMRHANHVLRLYVEEKENPTNPFRH